MKQEPLSLCCPVCQEPRHQCECDIVALDAERKALLAALTRLHEDFESRLHDPHGSKAWVAAGELLKSMTELPEMRRCADCYSARRGFVVKLGEFCHICGGGDELT